MSNKSIAIFSICLFVIVSLIGCTDNKKVKEDSRIIKSMKITINEKEYTLNLENTEEAQSFAQNVPNKLVMEDLDDNEKYVYTELIFSNNPINVDNIQKGDLMLYGDNCIVIFYKSFETTYSYTKIGHIDNLEDLGKETIIVEFSQKNR